ncbi:hypothetical protein N7495_003434 [Penicillium taxi]|uniref:uncharacterized protein n=1 Tax=Penicillium taxi TaxID=168475 RepID=UPI002545092B|nr:uncharacterized protein N7495_003434 [Penicillium taxi]KAJ5902906.1 hypothetical protein N7495_003434 [Penicillium taxi]
MSQFAVPWGSQQADAAEGSHIFLTLALLGLTSHMFFVRYNDVDRIVGKGFVPYVGSQICLWIWLSIRSSDLLSSATFISLANLSFFAPLFTSISIYRLFFHPLRSFPGPSLARLTSWWGVSKIARGANKYELHHELHKQYGDIVRIAPNFVSINRIDGLTKVYGAGTKCGKSNTFYNIKDEKSLQTETDLKKHGARRPPWEKALSIKRSLEYLPQLQVMTNLLARKITEDGRQNKNRVLINHWLTCFSFDVMGELGYSKSYGCLETGIIHQGIIDMEIAIAMGVVISPLPWLVRLITSIIGVPKHLEGLTNFAASSLAERKASPVDKPDVLQYVFDGKVPLSPAEELEDTMLLQLGGSDTANSTLIFAMYHIAASPEIQLALRKETESAVNGSSELNWEILKGLPLLEAVINETLRMHPPVPGGLPRFTPPEGITFGEIYIPGNVSVSSPTWTIQMDPENFTDPTTWNPYRFINPPENHNTKAWIPFSVGPFSCVGRVFAYMEMKNAIATVVNNFDIKLAQGEDGYKLLNESKDNTAICCEPVWLDMEPRASNRW